MWGSNEGRAWMSLGGVGHVELSEGFFGLTALVCMASMYYVARMFQITCTRKMVQNYSQNKLLSMQIPLFKDSGIIYINMIQI